MAEAKQKVETGYNLEIVRELIETYLQSNRGVRLRFNTPLSPFLPWGCQMLVITQRSQSSGSNHVAE